MLDCLLFHSKRSLSFLIAINAWKNKKSPHSAEDFHFYSFSLHEFLSMSYWRGCHSSSVGGWGGLIYMRKTDTISNKRGSLRPSIYATFQEDCSKKEKINEIFFPPLSIWIIIPSPKGNSERVENPFVCARRCKIPSYYPIIDSLVRRKEKRIIRRRNENLLIFYPFSISFFSHFLFRFLMWWLCEVKERGMG